MAIKSVPLPCPVIVCTIPKSGTHLLKGLLTSIFGYQQVYPPSCANENDLLYNELKNIPSGTLQKKIYIGHTWVWSSSAANRHIHRVPNKKIVLIRDPRDYVVSQAYFIESLKGRFKEGWTPKWKDKMSFAIYTRFLQLPQLQDKISAAIFGLNEERFGGFLNPVNEIYGNGIKWLKESPNSFLVRFEDLISSQQVGGINKVISTVRSLLDFIGCPHVDHETLLDAIYKGSETSLSRTFRRGKAGEWRTEFNANHVKQFKLAAPDLPSILGYEKDESWDLHSRNHTESISSNAGYVEKVLTSYSNNASTLTKRYNELLTNTDSKVLVGMIHAWFLRSLVFSGNYREALSLIDELLAIEPNNPAWNYYKAFCLDRVGEAYYTAVKYYDKAFRYGYEELLVRYNRGLLYKKLGNTKKASFDLQRALELDPKNDNTLNLLKEMEKIGGNGLGIRIGDRVRKIRELIKTNELGIAASLIEEGLREFSSNAELNYLYAICLHRQKKQLDKALDYYTSALKHGFDEYWVKYNRASLQAHLGQFDAALIDIKRALELKPDDNSASMVLNMISAKRSTGM